VSEDKIFVTGSAVVMLDSASAFTSAAVSVSAYADRLGRNLCHGLDGEGDPDLRTILADAIDRTARELDLSPGRSASSTVTIARQNGTDAEFLILGDNLIALPGETITDDRLHQLGLDGAYKTMAHLGLDDWKALSDASPGDLLAVLRQGQDWEESHDPEGPNCPGPSATMTRA